MHKHSLISKNKLSCSTTPFYGVFKSHYSKKKVWLSKDMHRQYLRVYLIVEMICIKYLEVYLITEMVLAKAIRRANIECVNNTVSSKIDWYD